MRELKLWSYATTIYTHVILHTIQPSNIIIVTNKKEVIISVVSFCHIRKRWQKEERNLNWCSRPDCATTARLSPERHAAAVPQCNFLMFRSFDSVRLTVPRRLTGLLTNHLTARSQAPPPLDDGRELQPTIFSVLPRSTGNGFPKRVQQGNSFYFVYVPV